MKPKILFIMHMPPPVHGAAMMGKYIHDSKIINEAFDCLYINPSASKEIQDVGNINLHKILFIFKNIVSIAKTAIVQSPDLCYFTSTIGGWGIFRDILVVSILKILRKKIVLHLHNKGAKNFSNKHKISRLAYHIIFKHTKVILLAEQLYDDISAFSSKKDIYYCPNGIPAKITDNEVDSIRNKRQEKAHFLFLSHMLKNKGVWVLLEACKILKEQNKEFKCTFIGKWSEISQESFNEYITKNDLKDYVTGVGAKYGDEKKKYFSEATAFIFPTLYETFGLVLLEAMEYSLPCIGSNEGGIPNIIQNGESGFIVEKNNAKELAKAMQYFVDNPQLSKKMGIKGRNRFLQNFTITQFEHRLKNILSEIIQK